MTRKKTFVQQNIPQRTSVREGVIDAHMHIGEEWGTAAHFRETASMYRMRHFIVLPYSNSMHAEGREAMQDYPELFTSLGWVNPDIHGPERVEEIRAAGFAGIKIYYNTKPYDAKKYMRVWEAAAKWGAPAIFHSTGKKKVHPHTLRKILRTFPEWKVQGAHFGSNAWRDAVDVWLEFPNLYFDFSGSIICRYSYEAYGKALGRKPPWNRMVFGTDKRHFRIAHNIKIYEDLLDYFDVPERTRSRIFSGNAVKLYKLGPAGQPRQALLPLPRRVSVFTLNTLEMPRTVVAGKPFDMAITLTADRPLPQFHIFNLHIYRATRGSLAYDPGGVNAETYVRNSDLWATGKPVRLDTFSPTLLENTPPGEYVMEAHCRGPLPGAKDPKKEVRYTFKNPEIGNGCIIGRFRVTSAPS